MSIETLQAQRQFWCRRCDAPLAALESVFFIGDHKLYTANRDQLHSEFELVKNFSDAICMEFGLASALLFMAKVAKIYHKNKFCSSTEVRTDFTGLCGSAFLVNKVVNVVHGEPEARLLTTGLHVVRDVFCKRCNVFLGLYYEYAMEESQRYKEGKTVLERTFVSKFEYEAEGE